ncbi:hypothetical protein PENTCL1PPCAC_6343 [Pristionchus entomophagus]|uniref:Inhibitor of growth protein n=1 Tax=Pristionchus entomophagus TaxID=358040 RepID=A0AAV5SM42_9BILA|nr:hypothetical protein PENTCL1PPCAC_6343 [Pristionchus entomophagus]
MLFLDDFLEMLEELPGELRERCKEIKDLDAEITAKHAVANVAIKEFFDTCESMPEDVKRARLKELQATFARLRSQSERKVGLTERMQDLLEKYNQHLEKEKMHLKYELEADNAGVTQVIEKRFADYVDQMFSQRKEKRKRPHPSISNGVSALLNGGGDDQPSTSRSASVTIPPSASTSKLCRLDWSGSEASPSPSLPSIPRARKNSLPVTHEETALKEARREAIRQQLQASLHLKTQLSGGNDKEKDGWSPSPAHRSRPSPSTPNTNTPQFVFSPSALSSPQTPLLSSPALSSMPNFVSTESRHGRPRKLTSRVQEMFNSNQSLTGHRERYRHSSTLLPPTPSISHTTMGNVTPPAETLELTHPPRSRDADGDEDGNDERPWCFCNEKSYGGMVACDNKECPYEWFHWPCVGLDAAPRGKWFCPHCEEKLLSQQ